MQEGTHSKKVYLLQLREGNVRNILENEYRSMEQNCYNLLFFMLDCKFYQASRILESISSILGFKISMNTRNCINF